MKVLSPSVAFSVGAVLAVSTIGQVKGADVCGALTGGTAASIAKEGLKTYEATANDCATTGKHPYISSLIIVPKGTTTKDHFTVAFTHGSPAETITATASPECDVKYTDVGNTKDVAAVTATIKCVREDENCEFDFKGTSACYTTPTAYFVETINKTWRRKAISGTGCAPADNACFDVCSKGYAVTAQKSDTTVKLSMASQVKSTACTCTTAVTADAAADGLSATGTKVTLDYDVGGVTVVTTQPDDSTCTATYVEGSYNPFTTGKTYTRGTYDSSTCSSADDCEFKCNAELALTTTNDKVTGKSATVASCPCADLTATVADDQVTTGTGTGVSYKWKATATGFDLTTVKGTGGSAVTCKAPYTEKATSGGSANSTAPAPSPTPTSGVSVNTIWAVAATAVIAVAGAFVMV